MSKSASVAQRAVREQPFERDLDARHEVLDEDAAGAVAQLADVRRGQDRGDAPERGDEPASSSARITPRLAESTSGLSTQG